MLVNLRGHRRKGELDNVHFLYFFSVFHIKISFGSSFALQTTFFLSFWWRGNLFQLFLQNKVRCCFNFLVIAEDSGFFATFL